MTEVQASTLRHLWLPCTSMAAFPAEELLEVVSASGPFIQLRDGRRLIDALSSWWCKPLGHGHPRLRAALVEQAGRFEHVIQAETTNAAIAALSERLGTLVPGLARVFYGGDGSMAVEIALKLALHAMELRGERRRGLAALQGGYHGETQMALAVGDQSLYGAGFLEGIPRATLLGPLPHVAGTKDAIWRDCGASWPAVERQLESVRGQLCAVIVEPVLQGAGQMRLYSPDLLARLRRWCTGAGVYLIADEILTGFGRTGRMLACEHASVVPDLVCLSKGLTAGWLPLSAVLVSAPIFELCSGGGGRQPFLHSTTYCGNPLAAAVAVEALKIYDEIDIAGLARALEPKLRATFERIAAKTGRLRNIRSLGGMVAADLDVPAARRNDRVGKLVCREAARRGALMRPLGDTLYWLPPLNLDDAVLGELEAITADSIAAVLPK